MPANLRFDIFSGSNQKDAKWLESVEGLAGARKRMEQLGAEVPGKYFVFSSYSRSILAEIDTTKSAARAGNGGVTKQSA